MKNKVVVITGASSGIGKALAYEFASKGSKIVIGARNHEKLIEIAEDIKLKGGDIAFAQADVSVESDCKNLILTAIERFGKIDVVINNAGISMRSLFEDVDLKVIKELMNTNFWGTVYCSKYALPHLLEQKGSLVGVSSIGGVKGLPGRTGYSSSKFAMQGLLECIRIENLKNGLHVMIAYPGFTATDIRLKSRGSDGQFQGESPRNEDKLMTAEQVASKIYAAIKGRKYKVILTSKGKATVFLNKFFPRWLDRMVYKEMAKEPNSPFK
jgi:short-subunit dehydrogenase